MRKLIIGLVMFACLPAAAQATGKQDQLRQYLKSEIALIKSRESGTISGGRFDRMFAALNAKIVKLQQKIEDHASN